MKERVPTGLWAATSMPVMWPEPNGPDDPTTKPGTKRIRVRGAMADDAWWGTDYGYIRSELAEARANRTPLVILDIDSPGGSVAGLHETLAELQATAECCNVVAYASGACQSAALWLASGCSRMYASPTAIIGSVGAIFSVLDPSAAMKDAGIVRHVWRSERAENKAPEPGSDAGAAQYQRLANAAGDAFLASIAKLRGVKGDLDTVADYYQRGASLPAQDALAAGWIDEIASDGADYRWLTTDDGNPPVRYTIPPAMRPAAASAHAVAKGARMAADSLSPLAALVALGLTPQDTGDNRLVLSADDAARIVGHINTARAQADGLRTALEQTKAQAEAQGAELATYKATEQKRAVVDLVAKHVKRGAIAPGQAAAWEAKVSAIGVDAAGDILALLPASAPMAPVASGEPVKPAAERTAGDIAKQIKVLMDSGMSPVEALAAVQKEG